MARLFAGLRFEINESLLIYCDNKQTIRLVSLEIPRIQTALRHVDIHNAWVRQEVLKKTLSVEYLATKDMPADGLTKALDKLKFARFVKQLGLIDVPASTD